MKLTYIRVVLVMFSGVMLSLSASAQEIPTTQSDPAAAAPAAAPAASPAAAPASAPTATPAAAPAAAPAAKPKASSEPPKAAQRAFNSSREERLEELRYKHLWIAYSLVWLVIFLFIRQTWRRSGAVEARLGELRERLATLEKNGG